MAELKDQTLATAAQVKATETLFAIASGTNQDAFLAVTQAVMEEVYGVKATQENLYAFIKAIVLGNRTEDDTAHTLTIPSPTQASVYALVKAILQASTNITLTEDDTDSELSIEADNHAPTTKTTHSNLGTSDTTVLQNLNDNDRIEIYFKETAGNNRYTDSWTCRFGDLDTADMRRILSASGNNYGVLYKKSGTSLVMRRGGGLNASNFTRFSVYTNYYA